MHDNLSELLGRAPVIIPHGILPDGFWPSEGSVFDAFAPGLPPVIFIGGQYYPLTAPELETIRTQAQEVSAASKGMRGLEMPQMPTPVTNFERSPDSVTSFEQQFERRKEQADQNQEQQETAETPISQPTQSYLPTDQTVANPAAPLVNIKDLVGKGTDLLNQEYVDDAYRNFSAGSLKPKTKVTDDSEAWLQWLLLKVFMKQDKDKN